MYVIPAKDHIGYTSAMNPKHNPHYFSRRDIHGQEIETHLERINKEFRDGFAFLRKYPKSVTIFGSSLVTPESETYKSAQLLGEAIARDCGYAVITGGGPGVMEAANLGAAHAHGQSVGLNVTLPHEHHINGAANDSMKFAYFFSRKVMLTFAAEAYVFFPGGFGTFDELFSILTLIQTGKIPHVPIVLFGTEFWNGFLKMMQEKMFAEYHTIDPHDLELVHVTDSVEFVVELIKKAPVSEWWRNIN